MECTEDNLIMHIWTLFPCNLTMHVLIIYHVKLTQSRALEQEHFDLRLLLALEINESQNLARLGRKPIKCQGWEGGREME